MTVIETSINLVQDMNRSIKGVGFAPHLREYPANIDTQHCIAALTRLAPNTTFSTNYCDYVTLPLITNVFYTPINQVDFPDNTGAVHCLADEFIAAYRDGDAYPVEGIQAFRASPVIEVVQGEFTIPLIGMIEYPVQSGRWYFGFSFGLTVQAAMDC